MNPCKRPYGQVDGPIPEKKLGQFLRAEERRHLQAGRKIQEGQQGAGEQLPSGRADVQWYTRHMMWKDALENTDSVRNGFVHSVDDLNAQEVVSLLKSVHGYFRRNECRRMQGGRPLVKKKQGPCSWSQWVGQPE